MKKILVFMLIIGCSVSNAQDKANMDKQLRESKKEVYKLLEDFDQQIAEAIERPQTLENTEFENNHNLKSGSIKITVKHDPQ